MAHGPGFELPKTAQRVLSIIPFISEREWDGDVQASASGGFRETLNKYALREIEERPILGLLAACRLLIAACCLLLPGACGLVTGGVRVVVGCRRVVAGCWCRVGGGWCVAADCYVLH